MYHITPVPQGTSSTSNMCYKCARGRQGVTPGGAISAFPLKNF